MFQVDNLRFRYPRSTEDTIKGISFEFSEGEIFGFLGPSGAGKSTTQRILIKILRGYQGSVLYRGRDLQSWRQELFNEIGVGFEMPVHFSKLSAMENLDFYARLYQRHIDVESLMKRVGLWEDRHKRVAEYSKGMKMRLNFVRALLNDPKMLFLDEPTNGLDPENARIVKDIIREFKERGGTVFLTTHLMHDADELCDRVAFIADGKIRSRKGFGHYDYPTCYRPIFLRQKGVPLFLCAGLLASQSHGNGRVTWTYFPDELLSLSAYRPGLCGTVKYSHLSSFQSECQLAHLSDKRRGYRLYAVAP